jgi:hypothetical protein
MMMAMLVFCDGGTTPMIINFVDKILKHCIVAMFLINIYIYISSDTEFAAMAMTYHTKIHTPSLNCSSVTAKKAKNSFN